MKKRIVIALGGNAILQPGEKGIYHEQLGNVEKTCQQIAKFASNGYSLLITHGNGPQIGNIIVQNELGEKQVPSMPLYVLGAQSQGMIGYMIQNRLQKVLGEFNVDKEVATLITQVEVDKNDQAFKTPTKPVGMFFSEEVACKAMSEKGETWIEDSGRGWRKVVPSPAPKDIVEKKTILEMMDKDILVISSGGGGIPVVRNDLGYYEGIEAVIDKDLAAEKLARETNADILMILTDVPNVMLNYKTSDEIKLGNVSLMEMKQYMKEGHFKNGSMEPKVRACVQFVEATKKQAIITSLDKAFDAINGEAGTIISWQH